MLPNLTCDAWASVHQGEYIPVGACVLGSQGHCHRSDSGIWALGQEVEAPQGGVERNEDGTSHSSLWVPGTHL